MAPETLTRDDELLGAHPRRHAGRVLLVSDCPDERGMYADYLRLNGFCALETRTAADAYRLAAELRPAAVVTDARLPGGEDGVCLTRRLKQDIRLRNVAVVILTCELADKARSAAEGAGCDLWIAKPCAPDALSRMLAGAIDRSREGAGKHAKLR